MMKTRNRLMNAVEGDIPQTGGGVGGTENGTVAAELEDSTLFAELAEHDEYAEPELEGAAALEASSAPAPESQPQGTPPTPPAAATPEQPAPVTQPTAVAPSTPEQPTPASAAAPEPAPATSPDEPVTLEKHRAEFLPKLQELYKLSPEEAEELRVEPEKALPKLAATLHYEVLTSAYNSVLSVLPNLVGQYLEQQKAITAHEERFYNRWGALKDPKYLGTVVSSVKAYRAANPKASQEEVIERAGLMAMLTLGLNPQGETPPPTPSQPAPAAPRPAIPAGAGFGSAPFQTGGQNTTGPVDDIQALIEAEMAGQI
jgi:hypothetical protein